MVLTARGVEVIRIRMMQLNISQADLATKVGCRQGTISEWLSGKQNFRIYMAKKLYAALGQDQNVEFLKHYIDGSNPNLWSEYITHNRPEYHSSCQEAKPFQLLLLRPFYECIDKTYLTIDNEEKRRLLQSLEGIICTYEQKHISPQLK